MLVKATRGSRCPMEDNPRTYVTDDPKGTEVPDTTYYSRLVAEGSLEEVKGKKQTGGDQ